MKTTPTPKKSSANTASVAKATEEEALRKSEEKYRTLFNFIDQGFVLCELVRNKKGKGIDYYMLELNPTYEKQTGISMEKVIGKTILQVFPTIDKGHIDTFAAVVDNQRPVVFEQYFEVNHRWHQVKVYPGEKDRFTVLFSDISERKQAEEKSKENEIIFKSIPDAIISADVTGRVTSWNECAEALYGFSKEEMIGQKMPDIVPTEFLNKEQENWQAIFAHQGYWKGEVIQTCKDGKKIYVSAAAHVIHNTRGAIAGYVAVNRDITTQKEVDIKIKKSEKQLRELSTKLEQKIQQRTAELVEKNTELVNINKELEAFTYVSSHDMQEPLRKIQTFAGRILEKENHNLSDDGKNYFRLMQHEAKRMQQLIQDLLAFSRLSIADRKFENTDLNIIIEEVKKEFKEAIDEKHAVIEVKEICEVKIIPFQFRQLMHNLISNALKFSNPKIPPHITIKSRDVNYSKINIANLPPQNKYCHITITDNGIGFEEEFAEKIFEVFQKLHCKDEYAGTGIGLAIVKKIVDNHNGMIKVTSEIKRGTIFNIYLPA